jgi:hypothetical protein
MSLAQSTNKGHICPWRSQRVNMHELFAKQQLAGLVGLWTTLRLYTKRRSQRVKDNLKNVFALSAK